MRKLRAVFALILLALVAACAEEVGAPAADIARARYVSDAAPFISVVSMVTKRNGRAAHSALFINASEQVIYDPAGTFSHAEMPERGDVLYGANPRLLNYYERYHARAAFYVHVQKIPVSAAVAETALRRVQAQGPSPKAFCTNHTTSVLQGVPGFERIQTTFFPENLRQQIAAMPNVQDRYLHENDTEKVVPEG